MLWLVVHLWGVSSFPNWRPAVDFVETTCESPNGAKSVTNAFASIVRRIYLIESSATPSSTELNDQVHAAAPSESEDTSDILGVDITTWQKEDEEIFRAHLKV